MMANQADINQVCLSGNLTEDPELKIMRMAKTQSKVVTIRFACNGKKGSVSFFKTSAWGSIAEDLNKKLKKGSKIIVSGKLRSYSWEYDRGKRVTLTEIRSDSILIGAELIQTPDEPIESDPAPGKLKVHDFEEEDDEDEFPF